jgi:signal transduction histidine kinase
MLALTFALAVTSFSVSRIVSESAAQGTRAASELIEHTLPDLQALMTVRTELGRTEALLRAMTEADLTKDEASLRMELRRSRETMRQSWNQYVSAPIIHGEPELIRAVDSDLRDMDGAVERALESARQRDRASAVRELDARAFPAIAAADAVVHAASDLNRETATDAAERITALRESSRRWGFVLDGISALLTVAAAYFVIRVVRRFWGLVGERLVELERFAGRVAHDIRSPLGSVTLALDMARRQPEVTPKTREYLDRGIRTIVRVGQLVDGLLVFAKAGMPGTERDGANTARVREVLDGIVEDQRPNAEEKGIVLDYTAPNEKFTVACSPGVLVSIASNLVTNAIKYMGDAPVKRIGIQVRAIGRSIRLEISDTGPGIAPELRDRVFDPFVRGTDMSIAGLGLGLATVRRLAEAHGGSVGLQPNVEVGSIFWVELPRHRELVQRLASVDAEVDAAFREQRPQT